MKYLAASALAVLGVATTAFAQELTPIDPVTKAQEFQAQGATTSFFIVAGILALGILIAGGGETSTNRTK